MGPVLKGANATSSEQNCGTQSVALEVRFYIRSPIIRTAYCLHGQPDKCTLAKLGVATARVITASSSLSGGPHHVAQPAHFRLTVESSSDLELVIFLSKPLEHQYMKLLPWLICT